MLNYGAVAYNAYCDSVNWKSIRGDNLPKYSEQSDVLKLAWERAGIAVVEEFIRRAKLKIKEKVE